MFYVYVLQSKTDHGLYIGFSKNLNQRLATHRLGKAFATSFRAPGKLIYYEAYLEEADALGREKYLKSGGGQRFLRAQLRHYFGTYPLPRPRERSSVERGDLLRGQSKRLYRTIA